MNSEEKINCSKSQSCEVSFYNWMLVSSFQKWELLETNVKVFNLLIYQNNYSSLLIIRRSIIHIIYIQNPKHIFIKDSWIMITWGLRAGLLVYWLVLYQLDTSWSYHRERSLSWGNTSMRSSCKAFSQLVIKGEGPAHCGWSHPWPSPLWVEPSLDWW